MVVDRSASQAGNQGSRPYGRVPLPPGMRGRGALTLAPAEREVTPDWRRERPEEAGAIAVYEDVVELLECFDESPLSELLEG